MRYAILALLIVLAGALALPAQPTGAAAASQLAPRPGLSAAIVRTDGAALLAVTSAGRFELRLDERGIVAWYDLRRDPARAVNLVAPGQTLVSHLDPAGAALRAPWSLELATPVLARVTWRGAGFVRSYTIWVAGQVAITTTGTAAPMTLARSPAARPGAALQAAGPGAATLFLDAWTGEDLPAALASPGAALSTAAVGAGASIVIPPEVGLRSPRLVVAGWPGPAHTLRQGATLLVAGQDYLAHWDEASATLYAQVLAGLPPGGEEAARSFSFSPLQTPGLSLGVQGRTLSPDGMLQVDGNMPDNSGERSTYDLFFIPYIQATPEITLTAIFQGPGAGVEFVLNGESRKVAGAAGETLAAGFTLPAYGEYRAEGYILGAAGERLSAAPADTIDPLALGRIVISIGDSITAGLYGDVVRPGEANFPVTSYLRSPGASQDRRNFFQYDNRNRYGELAGAFQRGYQVSLNNLLAACGGAPVFILNSGYGGLRLSYKRSEFSAPPDNSALAKLPVYLDQIEQLGARYLLVQLGTNDIFDGQARTYFRQDLAALVASLRGDSTGRQIWLARLPYSQFRTISDPDLLADRQRRLVNFNRDLEDVAAALDTAGRPVRLGPDFYSFFQRSQALLDDGTHPSQEGYEAMARIWAGQDVGLPPISQLPCEVFAAQGQSPPQPVSLTPRSWMPALSGGR